MEPIPYELIVDLAEGRLPQTDAAAIRARIAADPAAQAELAKAEALVQLMRSDESVDAPEHVISRALRLVRRGAAVQRPSLLRTIIAALTSDSWQAPQSAAAGLRALTPWPRALLLSAGDRELDLQIAPHGDRWQLRGQMLGTEEGGTAALERAGVRVDVALSELSEFTLPPVAAGRYTLVITQGELEIIVPDLELGPSPTQS
jgi:anti-sigma factor RsiW